MQQLYSPGCDRTNNGHMFLHQGTSVLFNSIDIVINVTPSKTISNVSLPPHFIATLTAKSTGQ